ncbi:MAG: hypothetical protein VKP62_06365 [Candidatus Sericytochromatia bacterium]|nr:hypothetical protein [Candidatus Sericytochromatia bacterium]
MDDLDVMGAPMAPQVATETGEAIPLTPGLTSKLVAQWREAKPSQHVVTKRGREAHRFYAGEQWDEKQIQQLKREGRPPVVINQVFKAINNVSGKQRDMRLSWKVLPRGENDVLTAEAATRGAKYLEDATNFQQTESRCFKNAAIGPYGWAEVGYDESDPTREPVYCEFVPWDEMLVDPFGQAEDLSDFRYLIRRKEVDLDLAIQAFPEHEEALRLAVVDRKDDLTDQVAFDYGQVDTGTYGRGLIGELDTTTRRPRVLLREHHWWEYKQELYLMLPDGEQVDYDGNDPLALYALQLGARVMQGRMKCFYRAIMAGDRLLSAEKSELPLRTYPYVCLWAFRDHNRRPYGLVETMLWPQRELNVNRSRANESMRSRWFVYQRDALGGSHTEQQVAQMLARSNFALEVNNLGGVQMGSDKGDLGGWMNLMETSRREVDDLAGQNATAYGDPDSTAKSGRAKAMQIAQQNVNLGELWDNWRQFRQRCGELMLALAIHYWSPEKWSRIVERSVLNENQEALRKAALGQVGAPPEADVSWVGRAVVGINSLFRYDLKIDDQAETSTERQVAMQQATDLIGMLPDPAKVAIVPDILRMSDFPGKDEMAAKAEAALNPQAPPPPASELPPPGPQPGEPPLIPPPPTGTNLLEGVALPPDAA